MNMGPIGCPETSVRNYHYSLRNNPEERSSHLLRGGSLMSLEYFSRENKVMSGCVHPSCTKDTNYYFPNQVNSQNIL
jgi:hypothetical protein